MYMIWLNLIFEFSPLTRHWSCGVNPAPFLHEDRISIRLAAAGSNNNYHDDIGYDDI